MKKLAIFALASLAMIALARLAADVRVSHGGRPARDRRECAGGVRGAAASSFAIARAWSATNVMAGWGMGMLIRFIVLAIYALLSARVLGLPVAAALVSLAAFFFVSTLLEPVLLKS